MDRNVFTLKLAAKEMERIEKKFEKAQRTAREKCKREMHRGHLDFAREHAEEVLRQRQNRLTFQRLGSRLDSTAARLHNMINAGRLTQTIQDITKSTVFAIKHMDFDKTVKLLDRFDQQCEEPDLANLGTEEAPEIQAYMVDDLIIQIGRESDISVCVEKPEVDIETICLQVAQEHDEVSPQEPDVTANV